MFQPEVLAFNILALHKKMLMACNSWSISWWNATCIGTVIRIKEMENHRKVILDS